MRPYYLQQPNGHLNFRIYHTENLLEISPLKVCVLNFADSLPVIVIDIVKAFKNI